MPRFSGAITGDRGFLEFDLKTRKDILFFSGFESESWFSSWGLAWGPEPSDQGSIVMGSEALERRSLRVKYPKGTFSSGGGLQSLTDFGKLGLEPRESIYLRYYVRFEPGFDFVKGGKLPGLAGGKGNTGGHKPSGTDGWSARAMWRADGKIVQYVYHPGQPGDYGEDFEWNFGGCPRFFKPGRWYCLETYVQMNTPGKKDGVIRSWLDGEMALEIIHLRFRDVDSIKIDKLYFETFFGGGDASWATPRDQFAYFDDFVLAENYIGPNMGVELKKGKEQQETDRVPIPKTTLEYFAGDGSFRGRTSHWSDGVYDLDAEAPVLDGKLSAHSVEVQLPDGKWGGVQFGGENQKASEIAAVQLRVLPTGCDVEFRVRFELGGKQVGVEKAVTGARGWQVNQWNEVTLPMSAFGIQGTFDRIVINSNGPKSVSAFYLDKIQLLK